MLTLLTFETFHLSVAERGNSEKGRLLPVYTTHSYDFNEDEQRAVQYLVKLFKSNSPYKDIVAGYFDIKAVREQPGKVAAQTQSLLLDNFVWYSN